MERIAGEIEQFFFFQTQIFLEPIHAWVFLYSNCVELGKTAFENNLICDVENALSGPQAPCPELTATGRGKMGGVALHNSPAPI